MSAKGGTFHLGTKRRCIRADELHANQLIEHEEIPGVHVCCRILGMVVVTHDGGRRAAIVRVLPDTTYADPIVLHFWADEVVELVGMAL